MSIHGHAGVLRAANRARDPGPWRCDGRIDQHVSLDGDPQSAQDMGIRWLRLAVGIFGLDGVSTRSGLSGRSEAGKTVWQHGQMESSGVVYFRGNLGHRIFCRLFVTAITEGV